MRALTVIAMIIGGLWGMDAPAQPFTSDVIPVSPPEIMQSTERPECAVYLNRFQRPTSDIEVWMSPYGLVRFKFYRGVAAEPDQVVVWETPDGTVVYPYTITLAEDERGLFCIALNREMS